jgi:predicted DNA-binding transcriptional regulator YafY
MRADRLISILMLLNASGRMTARQMANELEVCERTIYRDIDALSITGIPIYSECGPGGGYSLLESFRAGLFGLNELEMRALLMLSIPQPIKDLGFGQDLRRALMKLSTAVPVASIKNGSQGNSRIHLDSVPWEYTSEQVPHLKILHQGLIENRLIDINYYGSFDTKIEMLATPLGLVAKTNIWYLICEVKNHMRVVRISSIIEARILEEKFRYPEDFNLIAFWEEWCKVAEAIRLSFPVKLYVSPGLFEILCYKYGEISTLVQDYPSPVSRDGWVKILLTYESFEEALNNILGFGCAAEVIEPVSLRLSVIDFALQITKFYESLQTLS